MWRLGRISAMGGWIARGQQTLNRYDFVGARSPRDNPTIHVTYRGLSHKKTKEGNCQRHVWAMKSQTWKEKSQEGCSQILLREARTPKSKRTRTANTNILFSQQLTQSNI
ncbi:hypothetical protein VTJ04DRAFT_9909 [Mycothermus thermophilus]|uniref:uncharacterized protein n=1 Tax=Humicola insolens TaxID=85995 RepID=UPI0037443BD1